MTLKQRSLKLRYKRVSHSLRDDDSRKTWHGKEGGTRSLSQSVAKCQMEHLTLWMELGFKLAMFSPDAARG